MKSVARAAEGIAEQDRHVPRLDGRFGQAGACRGRAQRGVKEGTFEEATPGGKDGTCALYLSTTKEGQTRLLVTIPLKSLPAHERPRNPSGCRRIAMRRVRRRARLTTAIVLFLIVRSAHAAAGQEGVSPRRGEEQRDLIRVRQDPNGGALAADQCRGTHRRLRALAFTPDFARLCSAGLDKNVEVWNLAGAARPAARLPPRADHPLAGCPRTSRQHLRLGRRAERRTAGHRRLRSDGLAGRDPPGRPGRRHARQGPRRPPADGLRLAFSSDGSSLPRWTRRGRRCSGSAGRGRRLVLYDRTTDRTYGPERAAMIDKQPKLRPVVFLGNSHVVLPVFVEQRRANPACAGGSCRSLSPSRRSFARWIPSTTAW